MSSASRCVALGLRVLLAALFLVSAVAKLLAIDDFELYIFSYGFLSLNVSYLAARLCIAAECWLGLMIALGGWRRWINLAVLFVLLFFSLFLCYALLVGRTDSCHCMGRLADMPPALSLLKNAVLILLVLVYARLSARLPARRPSAQGGRRHTVLAAALAVATLVGVFSVSVPDNWMFGPEESRYDRALLEHSIGPEGALAAEGLAEGHHLVAFVTRGCPYCRMTREKITSIVKRHHLDTSRVHYYEPSDLPAGLFLQITYGQRPFVVLLDSGRVVTTYHYRNIDERQVARFLR